MAETEKLTINMNPVELGTIDLLVEQGFYSNRSDFIRAAIRSQLNTHADEVKKTAARKASLIGIMFCNRKLLEAATAGGTMVDIRVIGMVKIADDVTPELARATIRSFEVNGVIRAPKAVLAAISDRMGKSGAFFGK